MKVYIAGPMRGHADLNKAAFDAAAEWLRIKGATPINPADLPRGLREEAYMPICLMLVNEADGLYMLDGWENSVGANIERDYAKSLGKTIFYQEEGLDNGLDQVAR